MEKSTPGSIPDNPYPVGGALSDAAGRGFYGREEVFEFVRSCMMAEQRSPVLLYGQRRIGKSSILRQLPHRLPDEMVCVYYNLQGKASMNIDQVLYGLARDISHVLNIPAPGREETSENAFIDTYLPRAIEALGNHPERLVLLFDEFDVIDERNAGEDAAARRFIGYLYSMIDRYPQIGYIMVVGRKTEELSEEFNYSLLKNSVQMRIGRLGRFETCRIASDLAHGCLTYTDDALGRIYRLTAGQPFCTQLLCNRIWAQNIDSFTASPITIDAAQVDDAVLPALSFGDQGLNWFFDGLVDPAHRLYLAALAEVAPPLEDARGTRSDVENALRERQVNLDSVDFIQAPNELLLWDVLVDDGESCRFAVPMVGEWIRRERPLLKLEKEIRYLDPKAYKYYDLAVEAHRQGDVGQAINDYKAALKANPEFLRAQKGLAAALQELATPASLEASIEAYERVLEMDESEPPEALIQVLMRRLDEGPDGLYRPISIYSSKEISWFTRIKELDTTGKWAAKAARVLKARGFSLLESGAYRAASLLFETVGDTGNVDLAHRKNRIAIAIAMATALISFIIPPMRWFTDIPGNDLLKLAVWALAGCSFSSLLFIDIQQSSLTDDNDIFSASRRTALGRRSIPGALFRLLSGTVSGFLLGFALWKLFTYQWYISVASYLGAMYGPFMIGFIWAKLMGKRERGTEASDTEKSK